MVQLKTNNKCYNSVSDLIHKGPAWVQVFIPFKLKPHPSLFNTKDQQIDLHNYNENLHPES